MSGIKKYWKRLTKRSPVTKHSPDWMESIWWFINHPSVERVITLKEMIEMAQRQREVRENLTPEQFVMWLFAAREGIKRRSSGKPPLGVEELFKIAKEKMLRSARAGSLLLPKKMAMDGEAKRVAEAEATRLALQDRPRLDAEIEEWATGIDREKLKQWVNRDLEYYRGMSPLWIGSYLEQYRGSLHGIAKAMMVMEFDNNIELYDPMHILYWGCGWSAHVTGWLNRPYSILVNSDGARLALKSKFIDEESRRGYGEDVDWFSVDFRREMHNDEYAVKGRLRKMKELYMQVLEEMDLTWPEVEPEEEPVKTAEEKRQELEERRKAAEAWEMAYAERLEEERKRLALQDRPKPDAEIIERWAASIDRKEVERWISEDLEYVSSSKTLKSLRYENLTPEELRKSRIPDDLLWLIDIGFFNKAEARYRAEFMMRFHAGPIIDLQVDGHCDELDYEDVLEIIVRETKGVPKGKSGCPSGHGIGKRIDLPKKPTQSSIADFMDMCDKHFREVKVLYAIYKDVPNEGDVKRYAMYAAAKGILAQFDVWASACMHEDGAEWYWESHEEDEITKGLLKVMREHRFCDVKLRKMKEIYQEVLGEMGLLESVRRL